MDSTISKVHKSSSGTNISRKSGIAWLTSNRRPRIIRLRNWVRVGFGSDIVQEFWFGFGFSKSG